MSYAYRVGGSLAPEDPTYIQRKADTELHHALLAGEFCYVLTARQMGKSSLRLQARHRLTHSRQGRCAAIDLTRIGSADVTAEQWYRGLAFEILRTLRCHHRVNLLQWWAQQGAFSPPHIFSQFLETLLLPQLPGEPIFIFLDEIDSVRSLGFEIADFFALIRACYNQRADNPDYRRLTWALFGVATPSSLIANPQQTPFNIGRAIALSGFTFAEAQPLMPGLTSVTVNATAVLRAILDWTGGQPFLTQKLCAIVQQLGQTQTFKIPSGTEAFWVETLVKTHIIERWEAQDIPQHLSTIRDRLLGNAVSSGRLLGLYEQVLTSHTDCNPVKATGDAVQAELQLAGLILAEQGMLRVANPIYCRIFNQAWITTQFDHLRPYTVALEAWIASASQDESRLLSGAALEEALTWANQRHLSDIDYRFLSASQEQAAQWVRMELAVQEQANQLLAAAQRKARHVILLGYLSLVTCLVISAIALFMTLLRSR
ncbi:MAG: AAA-like domain-containing protein [Leptolyngbyaceae cyanobacterium]